MNEIGFLMHRYPDPKGNVDKAGRRSETKQIHHDVTAIKMAHQADCHQERCLTPTNEMWTLMSCRAAGFTSIICSQREDSVSLPKERRSRSFLPAAVCQWDRPDT